MKHFLFAVRLGKCKYSISPGIFLVLPATNKRYEQRQQQQQGLEKRPFMVLLTLLVEQIQMLCKKHLINSKNSSINLQVLIQYEFNQLKNITLKRLMPIAPV